MSIQEINGSNERIVINEIREIKENKEITEIYEIGDRH